MIHWKLILRTFGPSIKYSYEVENIVIGILIRMPSASIYQIEHITRKDKSQSNELFATSVVQRTDGCFPLNILIIQI